MCRRPLNPWLHWHSVRLVVDHADIISVLLFTSLTLCQRSRWLCGHSFLPKMKSFAKPFLPVHLGPRWSFFYIKRVENLVTLSLQAFINALDKCLVSYTADLFSSIRQVQNPSSWLQLTKPPASRNDHQVLPPASTMVAAQWKISQTSSSGICIM